MSQLEKPKDFEVTPAIWGQIIEALSHYQSINNGATPGLTTLTAIVNRKHPPSAKWTVNRIDYHLKEMVAKGLVKVVSFDPWTLTIPALKPSSPAPKVAQTANKREAKLASREKMMGEFMTEAAFKRCARAIAMATLAYYEQHGTAPGNNEITEMLGYKSTSTVSLTVNSMVERGWFTHKKYSKVKDFAVTALGREALDLLPQREPEVMEPKPVAYVQPVSVDVRRAPPQLFFSNPNLTGKAVFQNGADLSAIDTIDLLLELQSRGLKVSR